MIGHQKLSDKQMRWVMEQFNKAPEGKVRPLFICLFGSRLFGTHTDNSDYDVYAVHLEDSEKVLSSKPLLDTINVENKELNISLQSYELNKAMRLAINNNPNLVDLFLATPLYEDETYEPSNAYTRLLIRQSISKEITKPFISMVEYNLKKYVDDDVEHHRTVPKRYIAMISSLLRCCSYVDGVLEVGEFQQLCEKYLNTTEKKLVAEILREKKEGRDTSEYNDLAVGLIKSFIDKINKVKVLSKLPDTTDNQDKASEIILLTRLFQLKDSEKLKRLTKTN